MFTWLLTEGVVDAAASLDAAVTKVVSVAAGQSDATPQPQQLRQQQGGVHGSRRRWWPDSQFACRVVHTVALVPLWQNTWLVLTQVLPSLLPWRPGAARVLQDRALQAAFKFWLAMSLLMVLTLTLYPVTYSVVQGPVLGITAAVLSWHDRVESTQVRVRLICDALHMHV